MEDKRKGMRERMRARVKKKQTFYIIEFLFYKEEEKTILYIALRIDRSIIIL